MLQSVLANEPVTSKPKKPATLLELLVVAGVAATFAPAVANMVPIWSNVDYFAHGFLVPFVALAVALGSRAELAELPRRQDARGLIPLLAALGLYAVGILTGGVPLQGVALVIAVAGVVLFLRGFAWLRALAFPIAYLGFMVPLPPDWIAPLVTDLQVLVTDAAVGISHLLALPVARDGNVILVPGGSLFVAEACSGITSVITLLPIAVLLARFTQTGVWRRVVLVALVVPFAMLGNLSRVLFTVIASIQFGIERATEGALHTFAGVVTYGVACGALLVADKLLRRYAAPAEPAAST